MADGSGVSETAVVLRSISEMSQSLTELARQVGMVTEKAESKVTHKEMMTQMNELRREIGAKIDKGLSDMAAAVENSTKALQAGLERSQDEVARKAVASANAEATRQRESFQKEQERQDEATLRSLQRAAMHKGFGWALVTVIIVGGVLFAVLKAMNVTI